MNGYGKWAAGSGLAICERSRRGLQLWLRSESGAWLEFSIGILWEAGRGAARCIVALYSKRVYLEEEASYICWRFSRSFRPQLASNLSREQVECYRRCQLESLAKPILEQLIWYSIFVTLSFSLTYTFDRPLFSVELRLLPLLSDRELLANHSLDGFQKTTSGYAISDLALWLSRQAVWAI